MKSASEERLSPTRPNMPVVDKTPIHIFFIIQSKPEYGLLSVCVCHCSNIWVKLTDMRTSTLIPKSCDFYFASSPHWKELGSLWNCLDNLCTPLPSRQNNEYIFNGNLSEYIKRHKRVIKSGAWPLTTRNSYPVPPLCHGLICRSCLTLRLFITELPRALWQWNISALIYWV